MPARDPRAGAPGPETGGVQPVADDAARPGQDPLGPERAQVGVSDRAAGGAGAGGRRDRGGRRVSRMRIWVRNKSNFPRQCGATSRRDARCAGCGARTFSRSAASAGAGSATAGPGSLGGRTSTATSRKRSTGRSRSRTTESAPTDRPASAAAARRSRSWASSPPGTAPG